MPKTLPALLLAIATLAILACEPMTPTTPTTPAPATPAEPEPAPPPAAPTPAPEPTPTPEPPAAQTWPCDHYLGTWIVTTTNELILATRTSIQVGSTVASPARCVDVQLYHSLQVYRGRYHLVSLHSRDGRTGEIIIGDNRVSPGPTIAEIRRTDR